MEKLQITLAAARVNAGLTQEQAAKKMGVTKNTIINWEKGKRKVGIPQARMLSAIYSIPVDNIFLPHQST